MTSFDRWIEKWNLDVVGDPVETPASTLIRVLRGKDQAILKIARLSEEERGGEVMEWYRGIGAAAVLKREGPAILLELLVGERSLATMARQGEDDEATRILCETATVLHRSRDEDPPRNLVSLETWFAPLSVAANTYMGIFRQCHKTAGMLLADPRGQVVLHGDLHHGNVLDGGSRGWLAIDPKGLYGERGFEFANLFRNPDEATALAPGRMRQRCEIVVKETALDCVRTLQWVLAYAGLSAAWSIQDGEDPRLSLAVAEQALAELSG
jgi:streptomycin 6-kinase